MHRFVTILLAVVFLVTACGSPAPSPTPGVSATPVPSPSSSSSPTPLPSLSATIPAAGTTLAIPGGASVQIPAGAVPPGTKGSISASQPAGGPTDAWPARTVGVTWTIGAGGAKLAEPVTLTLPFDPSALPAGTDPSEVMLAYRDASSGAWVPVPSTVDRASSTVSATVSHLSDWAPFVIDWDYWLGFMAKAASGNVTDLVGALVTLTSACSLNSHEFVVDNSAANGMVKGCLDKVASGQATVRVTNLRAISLALVGDALDAANGSILDAGDTVMFPVGGTQQVQPVIVAADLSPLALGYQLTDITLRLLPGSDVFTKAGNYGKVLKAIVVAESQTWQGAQIYAKLRKSPPDIAGAAEEAFKLVTGADYLKAFVLAANAAGQEFGIPYLSALSPAQFNRLMLAVNLLVLDTTVLSWDVQYFIAAHSEVKVSWMTPPPAPSNVTLTTVFNDAIYTFTGTMRWQESPSTAVSGFRIYWSPDVVVGDVVCGPSCPPQPTCPPRVLFATVDAATSRFRFPDAPYGAAIYCGRWVSAFNSGGESELVDAKQLLRQ